MFATVSLPPCFQRPATIIALQRSFPHHSHHRPRYLLCKSMLRFLHCLCLHRAFFPEISGTCCIHRIGRKRKRRRRAPVPQCSNVTRLCLHRVFRRTAVTCARRPHKRRRVLFLRFLISLLPLVFLLLATLSFNAPLTLTHALNFPTLTSEHTCTLPSHMAAVDALDSDGHKAVITSVHRSSSVAQ